MTRLLIVLAALAVALGLSVATAEPANAHRNPCHVKHACPSDHATYRWRGVLCVKPTSDKRTASFRKRLTYAGLTYHCKR